MQMEKFINRVPMIKEVSHEEALGEFSDRFRWISLSEQTGSGWANDVDFALSNLVP